jgi:hypothetical protein
LNGGWSRRLMKIKACSRPDVKNNLRLAVK